MRQRVEPDRPREEPRAGTVSVTVMAEKPRGEGADGRYWPETS